MSLLRVGLTGGLAAGKSTVGNLLREAGFQVIDADRLVADLYRPRAAGSAAVERLFGTGFLHPDGSVDRPRLATRVFDDAEARRRLEEAVHPLVREAFEAIAKTSTGVIVLEAPLLVEAGWAEAFDVVVTVEAAPALRAQRAINRGLDPRSAQSRIAAQSNPDMRCAAADIVLHNDGTREELARQVEELVVTLERRAEHGR